MDIPNSPMDIIPSNEWDAIILSIIKPFLPLCSRDTLITVEDLQQEAWIGLLRACDKYDAKRAKFTTFAYTYIRGHVMRYITKATRHKPHQVDEDGAELDERIVEDVEVESNDLMHAIFGKVADQEHAQLLYDHFVYDKSFRQIAKESGVSHVAVANRINKLLDLLEQRLSHENA
jgi:RNA polymerase sigma factor (sigma-70 family)